MPEKTHVQRMFGMFVTFRRSHRDIFIVFGSLTIFHTAFQSSNSHERVPAVVRSERTRTLIGGFRQTKFIAPGNYRFHSLLQM